MKDEADNQHDSSTNKKYFKLLVLFTILVLISASVIVTLNLNSKNKKGITAMEGLPIANDIAHNWRKNATLFMVRAGSEMTDEGRFSRWIYTFCESSYVTNGTKYIDIEVSSNNSGKISQEFSVLPGTPPFLYPITSWSISSEEAYNIAINNEKIDKFISRYSCYVDGFSLYVDKYTHRIVWGISWMGSSGLIPDDPHNAGIQIDATTGDVLYVNADLTGSSISMQDVCIGFSIVLIAIVAVRLFKKRKKSVKENPDKEERGYERDERYER